MTPSTPLSNLPAPEVTPLTVASLAALTVDQRAPCLSLYQPTHRRHPENQEDPIRFRNLVKTLEVSLRMLYPAVDTEALLEPFEDIAHHHDFWNHCQDGLVVLADMGGFHVFVLPRTVKATAMVANKFHTTPLRGFLQSVDRYLILGLSLDRIRLFASDRDVLDEIDLVAGVPRTIDEALGPKEHHRDAPYHHADGGKHDDADIDAEHFFRSIDHAVMEHYSRPLGLPLILAALPEHQHLFHQISANPALVKESISINPDALTLDDLRARAWSIIEPEIRARLDRLIDEFGVAASSGRGSSDVAEVATAAAAGRIASLLVEANRDFDRTPDLSKDETLSDDGVASAMDSPFDDLGELVTKLGGKVFVVPSDRMPGETGVAAIFRY